MKKKEIKTIEEPILGTLTAPNGEYKGKVELGKDHFVYISTGIRITDEAEVMLPIIQKRFLELKELEPALRLKAITVNIDGSESLLKIKNDNWLECGQDREDGEDETELSAEDFVQKMTLESISMDTSGIADFGYDDGFIFFGHFISFRVTPDNEIKHAEFSG
jgi:hypothetical protein